MKPIVRPVLILGREHDSVPRPIRNAGATHAPGDEVEILIADAWRRCTIIEVHHSEIWVTVQPSGR